MRAASLTHVLDAKQHRFDLTAALARQRREARRAEQALAAVLSIPDTMPLLPWLLQRLPDGFDRCTLALTLLTHTTSSPTNACCSTPAPRSAPPSIMALRPLLDPVVVCLTEVGDRSLPLSDRVRAAFRLASSGSLFTMLRFLYCKLRTYG